MLKKRKNKYKETNQKLLDEIEYMFQKIIVEEINKEMEQ